MNEGYRKYLQAVIDARPTGVRQLFLRRGIQQEPTPELLQAAYTVFGNPFIGDLVNAVFPDADNAEGAELENAIATGETKKTFWDNIKGVFDGTANVLTAWGTAFGKNTATNTQTPIVIQQPAAQQNNNNTWLFLGAGLLIVIVLIIIILVKRKK